MSAAATQGKSIIDGGYIRTSLIQADAIKATQGFFENITVTGLLKSSGIVSLSSILHNSLRKPPNYEDNIKRFFTALKEHYQITNTTPGIIEQKIALSTHGLTSIRLYYEHGSPEYFLNFNTFSIDIKNENPLTMGFAVSGIAYKADDYKLGYCRLRIDFNDSDRTSPATAYQFNDYTNNIDIEPYLVNVTIWY